MIHLICTSNFGECKHEDEFGCELWDHDFENITSGDSFKMSVRDSIQAGISKYEKRITNVQVEIDLEQIMSTLQGRRVKNRVTVTVTGNLAMTNERIHHTEHFFIGPLSYY
jgi:phage baseplate assembly protein W